jgi:hypothetical protein
MLVAGPTIEMMPMSECATWPSADLGEGWLHAVEPDTLDAAFLAVSVPSEKTQRIRDPIHGLIVFEAGQPLDQLAWRLINAREFQRLRRVRQLGFSELVFPGATHTRFSHCIGVFHTARRLLSIIQRELNGAFDQNLAFVAGCAALLHDLGHGPFSHTFESIMKQCGNPRSHEEWTSGIIRGDTEIRQILDQIDPKLAESVAHLLTRREPRDIYDAVVSSQFDADRLDYLRRDRYMTGAGAGQLHFDWLLDCLRVGTIILARGDDDLVEIEGLYLSSKGLQAAEGYLLGRYHLYAQVYLHKTTRAAEKMLGALLSMVVRRMRDDGIADTGLAETHDLVRLFERAPDELQAYLRLDDSAVWSALAAMAGARDESIRRLALGLRDRRLYKCLDVGNMAKNISALAMQRFKLALRTRPEIDLGDGVLLDEVALSAYRYYEIDAPAALHKVMIEKPDRPQEREDIAALSEVVGAIPDERLCRVYASDDERMRALQSLWQEVAA